MQPLPKNVSITGLLIVLQHQPYQNPKMMFKPPMISFPWCQSSPMRGARRRTVETIAIGTNSRIGQSLCAFTFPTLLWQGLLDRRRSTTLQLPKLHPTKNGTILQVRVHGTILPLGNGKMFRGKPSRTKPKFMLVKSSRFVLKREVSSRWVTPCASLRVAPCFRETTSRTRRLMLPCSRSSEVHRPTWRQEKHWMLMAPCQGTGHRRAMESKHTPKHWCKVS